MQHERQQGRHYNGWEELYDYDNRSAYYYNASAEESSWEPPDGWPYPINRSGDILTPKAGTNVTQALLSPKSTRGGDPAVDPGVQSSRRASAERPQVARSMALPSPVNGSKSPSKWVKEYDEPSSSFYYVNKKTNHSQWERPPDAVSPMYRSDSSSPKKATRTLTSPLARYSSSKASERLWSADEALSNNWDSSIDEVTGERFYIDKRTGKSQWEKPDDFIEPASLFQELRKLEAPESAATQMRESQLRVRKLSQGYDEMVNFSTAASEDELKKHNERVEKARRNTEEAASAGLYKDGAMTFIFRQRRAAEMLQKYVRGRKARRELKRKLKEKDLWVRENAKKTGAYDDIFDRIRERGAKIRTLDMWEQWLDSSGRIFYYNPMDARGQWVPPLIFEQKMAIEETSKLGARSKALKEDAAMRRLERNWENRTDVESKWNKLELVQKDKMQNSWNGNSWIRGIDSLRVGNDFTRVSFVFDCNFVGAHALLVCRQQQALQEKSICCSSSHY